MNIYRNQRGVAAVELGFILIPLVLVAFGITEFGRAIYQYNALTKATRDATRFLSLQGPGDIAEISAAINLTVFGTKVEGSSPLVPNLTIAMVSVCDSTSCIGTHQNQATGTGVINLVTVTVTDYPFTSLVPFVVPSMTFGPISTTMRQVL